MKKKKQIKEYRSYDIKGGKKKPYIFIDYNKQGNVLTHKLFGDNNSLRVSKYKYDDSGKLLLNYVINNFVGDDIVSTTENSFTYNDQGSLTSMIKDGVIIQKREYDDKGNCIYENNITNKLNMETTYKYNDNGNIVYTKNNASESFATYDDNGNLTNEKILFTKNGKPSINEISYEYDKNRNMIFTKSVCKTEGEIYYDSFKSCKYDENNNLTYSNEDEVETWYTYDKNNNMISEINNNGGCIFYNYNESGMVVEYINIHKDRVFKGNYEYDDNGNCIYYKDSTKTTKEVKYNEYGDIIYLKTNYPDDIECIREYTYYEDDNNDNII